MGMGGEDLYKKKGGFVWGRTMRLAHFLFGQKKKKKKFQDCHKKMKLC